MKSDDRSINGDGSAGNEGDVTGAIVVDDRTTDSDFDRQMRAEVRGGLTAAHKWLPPKYFYDELGSQLFERITGLDEYYQTRTERTLLARTADELVNRGTCRSIIELGSGNSSKTRVLIDAMYGHRLRHYMPIDISREIVEASAAKLRREYPRLSLHCVIADFTASLPLQEVPGPALIVFLGGTIGNLHREEAVAFLRGIAAEMRPDDRFLLGIDLVKDPNVLHAAYNDARGVTAEFNLNVLRVLNRELDATFRLDDFVHYAFYDPRDSRIEMHLAARRAHSVDIGALGLEVDFYRGESILTEISRKFTVPSAGALLADGGMQLEELFTDDDERFALCLARRTGAR